MPGIPRADILRHAAAILADTPLPADWPRTGRAWPAAREVRLLRQAGWPVEIVTALIPQREHRGVRAGQRTEDAVQPIAVVPRVWLEDLARRLGCDLSDLARGYIPDA